MTTGQTCKIKTVPVLLVIMLLYNFTIFVSSYIFSAVVPIVLKLGGEVKHEARKTPFLDYRYLDLIVVSLWGLNKMIRSIKLVLPYGLVPKASQLYCILPTTMTRNSFLFYSTLLCMAFD